MSNTGKEPPALPSNVSHVMRRIRACESELTAQLVLEHALRAAILADRERQAGEAVAFEAAMKQTWQMIDPLRPPVAGSYALGEHNGIAAALKTVRENFERAFASIPAPQAVQADSRALALLRESRNTLFMWRDVAPAVSLLDDIDKFLAAAPSPDGKAEQAEAPSYAPLTGRTHDLKIDGPVFSEVVAGRKLFEIRKNDRGFQCGDLLRLRETRLTGAEMAAGEPLIYTGREITVRVIGITHGPKYGLADGFCVMSIATQPTASVAGERQTDLSDEKMDSVVTAIAKLNSGDMGFNEFVDYCAALATQPAASNAGEREAFDAWVARVQPRYWQAEAWQTEAWAMWQSISAALASKPLAGEQKPVAAPVIGRVDEADMFWDSSDPERFGHDINEIIEDYGPGEVVEIDQAKRLPSIKVRVLPPKDENSYFEYEVVEVAARTRGEQGGSV